MSFFFCGKDLAMIEVYMLVVLRNCLIWPTQISHAVLVVNILLLFLSFIIIEQDLSLVTLGFFLFKCCLVLFHFIFSFEIGLLKALMIFFYVLADNGSAIGGGEKYAKVSLLKVSFQSHEIDAVKCNVSHLYGPSSSPMIVCLLVKR